MQDDDTRDLAIGVLAGAVALVLAVSIGIAVSSAHRHLRAAGAEAAPARTAFGPVETLHFAEASDKLNSSANESLTRMSRLSHSHPRASVFIAASELHPVEAELDPRLAFKRALAVRHALEARGVAPDRITTLPLTPLAGGEEVRRARRVEVRLE